MKWLGSILICCGGGWCYWLAWKERDCRIRTLRQLLSALWQMREEIRQTRVPFPDLLDLLAERQGREVSLFFAAVSNGLRDGEPLGEVWRQESERLPLPPESQRVWLRLGSQLQGDETCVTQAITYAEQSLERYRQQAEEERKEADRRTAALCFSASMLLVILLI